MKPLFPTLLLVLCGLCAADASARPSGGNPYIAPEGAIRTAEGITVSHPASVMSVDLTVTCEETLCGPYARYAQKYLGARAPLSDKTTWRIDAAQVALLDPATAFAAPALAAATRRTVTHADPGSEFARLQTDRTALLVPAQEDAARDAANAIFALRRQRLDLISGEVGENVFGGGLEAALAEIDRQEQRYLELFLGKRIVTTSSHRYTVMPQTDKKQYVVCRFSASEGLLAENDLSGDMVVLQLEPAGEVAVSEATPKETAVVICRVAAPTVCTVIADGREYARTTLPLFEMGRTVRIAAPARR